MNQKQIFIITGEQGAGKTTKLLEVLSALNRHNIEYAGFYAEGLWQNNLRSAFSLIEFGTKERKLLCRAEPNPGFQKTGRFHFDPETIGFGEKILRKACISKTQLIVIDEIGLFELYGKVWANVFQELILKNLKPILITVREKFLTDVVSYFNLENVLVFNTDQDTESIINQMTSRF